MTAETTEVKVISLERSVDRRKNFVKMNNGINYAFIDGIDGTALSRKEMVNPELFLHPLDFPGPGAYGCALSHLKLWDLAIASNAPVTVCEDDAVLRMDFHEESKRVISTLPQDWDFILWGWNFDSTLTIRALPDVSPVVMLFSQNSLRDNIDTYKRQRDPSTPFRLDKCFGIPAYTISPKGAKIFKSNCFPMRNFEIFYPIINRKIPNTGIDMAMNRIYPDTRSFVAFPPLAITENNQAISTIQNQ